MPITHTRFLRPVKLIACLLCVGFTLYRVQVSIDEYSADNSVTSIGYQDFLSEPGYTYPAITLCLEKQSDDQSVPEIRRSYHDFNRTSQEISANDSSIQVSSRFSYDRDIKEDMHTMDDPEFILNKFLQDPLFWCFTETLKPRFKVKTLNIYKNFIKCKYS